MTAFSASLARGNCPRLDVNATWASPVGSPIGAIRGAAAYPIAPMAVTVAPTAIMAVAIRNLTIRRWLGNPPVRDEQDGWIRRNGLIHKGATDCGPAIEARRNERSVGVGFGSFLARFKTSRTARRSSTSRRQFAQSTRWLSSRSRSVSSRAPSTNADRNSARSAQGAFLTPTSPAPDFPVWS